MFSKEKSVDFSGSIIVIPSISIGNVPQLAMDLIINNLKPEYIGFIVHEHLIPIVGPNAFEASSSIMSTSCEVYYLASKKIVFLQIRGSIVPGKERQFAKELIDWAMENKIKNIITLSSILADVRKDKDLDGCQIRYMVPREMHSEFVNTFKHFQWREYEDPRLQEDKERSDPTRVYVPGGGCGQCIYEIGNELGCSCTLLMMFAYEGDNRHEATVMADALNNWLEFTKEPWVQPISWCSLYGNPPPEEIY